jgi:para-aminobenzoate synthetase component 1
MIPMGSRYRSLPVRWIAQVAAWRGVPFRFHLESAAGADAQSRYSFLGAEPYAVLQAVGRAVEFWHQGRAQQFDANPFDVLETILKEWRWRGSDRPAPMAVGYLGYELGRQLETVGSAATRDQQFPDVLLAFYDRFVMFDHLTGRSHRIDHRQRSERALSASDYQERFVVPAPRVAANFDKAGYLAAIERAKQWIAAGDIYQVNLSQRFVAQWEGDPYALYRKLTNLSPAAYAAFVELGNRSLLSCSPELFLKLSDRQVVTRPIKGTRRRGAEPDEDRVLADQLWASEKDEAELTMIVDLERNDLGRVCVPGSVVVEQRRVLESHPTVWHAVATVTGRLRAELGPVDLLRATFPGGSVTGAPKIRACQIIDQLEPTARAAYTGAIGWIGLDGDLTLSVTIRTMLAHAGQITFQAGGAITADSDPESEYQETLIKARAMARAIEAAQP